jgi:hypothetical protein
LAGYVRQDVGNNIENNEIADATYLDQEFDAIQSAFNSSTGHNHDGTTGEGAPILAVGPAQDFIASSSIFRAKTTDVYDLGSTTFKYKDLWLSGTVKATGGTTGQIYANLGTSSLPSYSFIGDTNTGMSAAVADTLVFSTSGTSRMSISSAGVVNVTGALTVGGNATITGSLTADSLSGDIVATSITSGTLPSGRISGSYTGLTGTGALSAGSITSGFGSIDIGSDTLGAGAITSTATIISSQNFMSSGANVVIGPTSGGSVQLRPSGALGTTNHLVISNTGNHTLNGNLTVSGDISGDLAATDLTGTIASARLAGAYTGITQVGTLTELTVDGFFFDGSSVNHSTSNSSFILVRGGTSAGAITRVFGSTHATNANMIVNDADRHIFRTIGATNLFDLQSTGLILGSNVGIDFAGTGAATTRTNLGLGTMATQNEGTSGSQFRDNTANDAQYLIQASNLSDLTNPVTARSNLGLGSISTLDAGTGASNFRNNSQNDARFHNSGTDTLDSGDLPTDSTATDWIQVQYATVSSGQIGTYALLRTVSNSGAVNPSSTVAGSSLYYASASDANNTTSPGGTWRCMGYIPAGAGSAGDRTTLFMRIS